MKKDLIIMLILATLLIIWIFPVVSAEVFISQPKTTYNINDMLNTTIKVTEEAGILKLYLIGNEKNLFYAEYINLQSTEEKILEKEVKLNYNSSIYYILAEINSKEFKSSPFILTDKLKLSATLDKEYVSPEEEITISGLAVKEDNSKILGTFEIYLFSNLVKSGEINNGNFSDKITLPKILSSYEYNLTIKAYDKEKLNSGEVQKLIRIKPKPSSLEIKIENAKPGQNMSITPILYDQNNNTVERNVSISLDSPEKDNIFSQEILSGKSAYFFIPNNAEMGNWKVKAFFIELEAEKHFYVEENPKLTSQLEGDILILKNIGNVPLTKIIPIQMIGKDQSYTENVQVSINEGEETRLKLEAPTGEYNVKIEDKQFPKTMLTGDAVKVQEISSGIISKYPYLAILILAAIIFLFFYFSHRGIKREIGKIGQVFSKEVENRKFVEVKLDKTEKEKSRIQSLFEKYVDKDVAQGAIQNKLKQGKHVCSFLFTDIRGYTKMSESNPQKTKEILDKYFHIITEAVHSQGGTVSQLVGDCVEAMFNVTKEYPDHVLRASKAALKIKNEFIKFNKEVGNNLLRSGIGVDFGEVFLTSVGTDVKRYQPIGAAINIAYNISKKSTNRVFISKNVYEVVKNNFKTKKIGVIEIKDKPVEIYEIEPEEKDDFSL